MFGPNVKTKFGSQIYHTHRDADYLLLLRKLEKEFQEGFSLKDYKLLFIGGSGTLMNEIVLSSLNVPIWMPYREHKFENRLYQQARRYAKFCGGDDLRNPAFVYYETAKSHYTVNDIPKRIMGRNDLVFADMISAFPYDLPCEKKIDIWTGVSGKQLGAYAGVGIIGIKKTIVPAIHLKPAQDNYLSLENWIKNPVPYTPPIALLYDLLETVEKIDHGKLCKKIGTREIALNKIVPNEFIIGRGPVFTIKEGYLTKGFLDKWNLYKCDDGWQIFLWSGMDEEFEMLINDMKGLK